MFCLFSLMTLFTSNQESQCRAQNHLISMLFPSGQRATSAQSTAGSPQTIPPTVISQVRLMCSASQGISPRAGAAHTSSCRYEPSCGTTNTVLARHRCRSSQLYKLDSASPWLLIYCLIYVLFRLLPEISALCTEPDVHYEPHAVVATRRRSVLFDFAPAVAH